MTTTVTPTEKSDPFFLDDFTILFSPTRLMEFFPTADQTMPERMNALTRLVIFSSVALSLYQNSSKALHVGAVLLIVLVVIWRNQTKFPMATKAVISTFRALDEDNKVVPVEPENTPCVIPTTSNPFMNPLYGDDPKRPEACRGPGVQEMAANLLDAQLLEDPEDIFGKANMQRQFYTIPSTTIPDKVEQFQDYLFRDYPNCKTNGSDCAPYQDIRLQREFPVVAENDVDASQGVLDARVV